MRTLTPIVLLLLLSSVVDVPAQSTSQSPVPKANAAVGVKVLFLNSRGKILLVFDERRQAWEVPGAFLQGQNTTRNLIDEIARDVGITYVYYQLRGLFTYHNPQSGSSIVRPYYTARFQRYIDPEAFKKSTKARWFNLSDAKKLIPYPASVRIVEKLIRSTKGVWGGAFEEYGYTSPMTDSSEVKFRIIEDFYRLK